MSDATDVLQAIDQLRRDLSGYHGQLKAHNDLQRHCDHQRERIVELEAIHARDKAENTKLRELVKDFFDVPCQCLKCEHYNYEEDRCDLRDRARELGIEVTA